MKYTIRLLIIGFFAGYFVAAGTWTIRAAHGAGFINACEGE